MRTFRILAVLMMAVVCVSLSSCSNDDDKNEVLEPKDNTLELLIGTWEGTDEYGGKKTFVFERGLTYQYTYTGYSAMDGAYTATDSGRFEYFPTRYMFVTYPNGSKENIIYTVVSITKDTLILNNNGHSDIITFKRK